MLFMAEMEVSLPRDLPANELQQLLTAERERAQEIMRSGRWPHLWRVAGRYANVSIFDVASVDELHDLISSLPMFAYFDVRVTPLATHPSALS